MKQLIVLILCIKLNLFANTSPQQIIRTKELNLDLKSYKGWIRVLSNKDRLVEYGLYNYSNDEIDDLKDYIKKMKKEKVGEL